MAELGLTPPEVPSPLNLFMNIPWTPDGDLAFAAPPRGMAEVCRHVARGGEEPAVDNEHREEDGCDQSDPIALRCRARAALEVGRRCPQEPERDRDDQRAEREARAIRIQRTECVGTESRG